MHANIIYKLKENLYNKTSFEISKEITRIYSTSFYWSSKFFEKDVQNAIFSIYGFVRFADEIVDSFHEFDKKTLLDNFEKELFCAIENKISLNPVLQSFLLTIFRFNIPLEYIKSFLKSMHFDLSKNVYTTEKELNEYIYGSAEVVGLMCLKVFTNNNEKMFNDLKQAAIHLGAAFQKVNFLRDLKNDIQNLNRSYFPDIKFKNFNEITKYQIIKNIELDFENAENGIKRLPEKTKLAVLIAYYYYLKLLKKIKKTPADLIVSKRIRVSNFMKIILIIKAFFIAKLKLM